MRLRWVELNEQDSMVFRTTMVFLKGRLEERATIEWALELKPSDSAKQLALIEMINDPNENKINEQWLFSWRLIEESWNDLEFETNNDIEFYGARRRLLNGDRSGSLIKLIVKLVTPRLKVEKFSEFHLQNKKIKKRITNFRDIFSAGITSGKILELDKINFSEFTDISFLNSLALSLESAVTNGLDIARRIGWDEDNNEWILGQINRVYHLQPNELSDLVYEPDRYSRGLAPAVKILYTIVSRLVDINFSSAIEFVNRWKYTDSPVHVRLWAAISRNPKVTPADDVSEFLLSLKDHYFWEVIQFPEVAELRAVRFGDFNSISQKALCTRIRKLPPRNRWPRNVDSITVKRRRQYWAIRELQRIMIAGNNLPPIENEWFESNIGKFSDLSDMSKVDEDFVSYEKARVIPPSPDNKYNLLEGEKRLKALNTAIKSPRVHWENDPGGRAVDWINQNGNSLLVLSDLESMHDGGDSFASVWDRFGWAHSPNIKQGENLPQRDLPGECLQVLSLLTKLSKETIQEAISGITHWLSTWARQVVDLSEGPIVWLKVWPIAIDANNNKPIVRNENKLNTVARSSDDNELLDLDTLNTPVGKLVGVFLTACPTVKHGEKTFQEDSTHKKMRDEVSESIGSAGLIVNYRLIETLRYFLKADNEWTQIYLLPHLLNDNPDELVLWRAVARRTRFDIEMKYLGPAMVKKATDQLLPRDTRRSLVFSLIIECLNACREGRKPAVPFLKITQMIRILDDEVRAYAAETVQRYVSDMYNSKAELLSHEKIFDYAVVPFLKQVWPQERSLNTPSISKAFADLPAETRGRFAEAVEAIERFLVPFECWSMLDYGLYGDEFKKPKLMIIDNYKKASAFLKLLDLTIGPSEAKVIPYDLSSALEQINKVSTKLTKTLEFRRLATAARRE